LADSLHRLIEVVDVLESNRRYVNLNPMGEPQLGRRGLYGQIGGASRERQEEAILWVLNQSDGTRSLLEIADRSHLNFKSIAQAARALLTHGLLRRAD
jgi:aminopeptidase-like protein